MADNNSTKLNNLERQVNALVKQNVDLLKKIEEIQKNSGQLIYPANKNTIETLGFASDWFLKDKILDLVWKKIFYYSTFFESLDGWTQTVSNGASVVVDGTKVTLTTGATTSNAAEIKKAPVRQNLILYDNRNSFRTNLYIKDSVSNEIVYIVIGELGATGKTFYGFKVSGASLYGVSSVAGINNETTVLLQSISANTSYDIEARYEPNVGIRFFIGGTEMGNISDASKIPLANNTPATALFDFKISTSASESKILELSFTEFIQQKKAIE